jgi:hypothetical protein
MHLGIVVEKIVEEYIDWSLKLAAKEGGIGRV